MTDEKTEAVDKLADIIKMVIRGWPIYGVVVAMLWGYGELWLDKKIAAAIADQTLVQPAIVGLTGSVQTNTNAINRVSEQVEIVEEDTKAILRIMAGEGD
jgi:NADH:ubiquinone oxidoreductase subunit H